MSLFDNFPFTNMHQLNLDWILKTVEKFTERVKTVENTIYTTNTNVENAVALANAAEHKANEAQNIALRLEQNFGGNSLFMESEDFPGCYYRFVNGVSEWLNPPLQYGVEYRTIDRLNEKPVYTKVVNVGACLGEVESINCDGFVFRINATGILQLPGNPLKIANGNESFSVWFRGDTLIVYGDSVNGVNEVIVQIWYTYE